MTTSATPITPVATFTTNVYPPLSGTTIHAVDLESAEQAFCNRWAWLLAQPRVVEVLKASQDDATSAHAAITTSVPATTGTFANMGTKVTLPGLKVGDVVQLQASFFAEMSTGAPAYLRFGNTLTSLAINNCVIDNNYTQGLGGSTNYWRTPTPVMLSAFFTVTSTYIGTQDVYIQGRVDAGSLQIDAPFSLVATVYRTGL